MPDRAHPPDQVGRKLQPEKVVHLPVAVLLDHVDALMRSHELSDRAGQRQRTDPQVVGRQAPAGEQVAGFDDRVVGGAVRDQADRRARRGVGDQ